MNDLIPTWDESGLVGAVVQDVSTSAVLMLGWMDAEALRLTRDTGRVHFWSRSRQALWEKGATSGNSMEVVSIVLDCDGDALLVKVRPRGPACHKGSVTCWGNDSPLPWGVLESLWGVVAERAATRPERSYTANLLESGPEGPGRKVVEEAMEVLLAAKDHAAGDADDRRVAEEAADLVYHLMVLLAERGLTPSSFLGVLDERAGG
ncbi:MAG TPA: bifunctional phosphoribosyl-AMP cyclohydrolase/phosphoribosyl-ATP diphosphatase HisIE [Acidimicrobiia bacterium]|nr:bifunctional phosphoribosyl-AMP cyclohydrolase/phosphoribosyl-ATP diphosphatase HisIE [Acidimicrobiia bacterium]